MTKVTNDNGTFYIPDEIANDPTKTVAELLENATPWELHTAQERVAQLQAELDELNAMPDEVLVPNEAKMKIPEVEQELTQAQEALNNM